LRHVMRCRARAAAAVGRLPPFRHTAAGDSARFRHIGTRIEVASHRARRGV
jgi:hypothetical protein